MPPVCKQEHDIKYVSFHSCIFINFMLYLKSFWNWRLKSQRDRLKLIYTIWPEVFGHLTIKLICGSSPNCFQKVGSTQLYRKTWYTVALQFPFNETKRPNLFQHDNEPVHKVRSMKAWFAKVGVENSLTLTSTLPNIFGMNWNARPSHQH